MNYKNLIVWQKSHDLTLCIYKIKEDFPTSETYGLRSQLRRAAYSIPSNIAEGSGRATKPDYLKFLNISYASLKEVEYFLLLSKDLNYISQSNYLDAIKMVNITFSMLSKFITSIKNSNDFHQVFEEQAAYNTDPIDPTELTDPINPIDPIDPTDPIKNYE